MSPRLALRRVAPVGAVLLCACVGAVAAEWIPSARTASAIVAEVRIGGADLVLQASPDAYAAATADTAAVSLSTTMRALQERLELPVLAPSGSSAFDAESSAALTATATDRVTAGGTLAAGDPLASFVGSSATLALASTTEPMFARASAWSTGVLDGVVALNPGGAWLDLRWSLGALNLTAVPAGGFALASERVQLSTISASGETSLGEAGFVVWLENGAASIRFFDSGGTSTFQGPVGETLTFSPGQQLGTALALPEGTQAFALRLVDTHTEVSIAAPPRAAVPVLAGIGNPSLSGADGARLHWESQSGILSFDPIPIDWSGGLAATGDDDPLRLGGYIAIDDLYYAGELDGRRYFSGGRLTLADNNATPLLVASLPTMVFEDSLLGYQGFDLFAPILNILDVQAGRSPWLDGLMDLLALNGPWLPELFLGFDLSALGEDPWDTSFDAPLRALLSLTGAADPLDLQEPRLADALLLGLVLMALLRARAHRDGASPLSASPASRESQTSGRTGHDFL